MGKFTIRKQFKFEMAHQLKEAYSDCCKNTIHGHSYICEVFIESNILLDGTGMVVDFGKFKDLCGEYIDSWDHALVMPNSLPKDYLKMLLKYNKNLKIVDYNPTAEEMARDIFRTLRIICKGESMFNVAKVRLHETATGWAEYER